VSERAGARASVLGRARERAESPNLLGQDRAVARPSAVGRMLSTMVVLCGEGLTPRGSAGLYGGFVVCALLSGCILDNPKFDRESTTFDTVGGSTSQGGGSSTASETEATGGTESASGTSTGEPTTGVPTTGAPTTGVPTTGEPTTGEPTTSTVGTITDGTSTTTGSTSTTGDDMTDSDASTGNVLCEVMEKIDVFLDADMDGVGGESMEVCPNQVPEGYVELGGDCDDDDPEVKPGATELCDGVDNNCNGLKDEYSESNLECDLVDAIFDKECFLATHEGHFYYTCKAKRIPADANGICSGFAVADGAKSYHVKIDSAPENEAVAGFAAALGADISIGLHDTVGLNLSKDHRWIEGDASLTYGETFGQPPWSAGQPDKLLERWTQMTHENGLWGDIGAVEFRSFVCEAEPKP